MATYVRHKKVLSSDDSAGRADTGFAQIPSASEHINQTITWGEPAKICEASMDKHCPHCGISRAKGFDLGIAGGKVFGARCDCGFSF